MLEDVTVPTVELVALDASAPRLAVPRQNLAPHPNAEAIEGDAQALPFADDSFDLVYSRFLFEYLPDKPRAAAELARVCRPGGTVLLHDLDGQFVNHYPPDPKLEQGIAEALSLLAQTGFDPLVGRKLPHLLGQAGLADVEVEVEPYHLVVGRIGAHDRSLWKTKLEIAAGAVAELGFPQPDRIVTRFLDYLDREDTLTFSTVFTAVGCKVHSSGERPRK